MTDAERAVRAAVYECFIDSIEPTVPALVTRTGLSADEVRRALEALADDDRLALDETGAVTMAHPFSSVATGWEAVVGDRTWHANCAWDALAILALLGDGSIRRDGTETWRIVDGRVEPEGIIHFVVPPREFWADIGFT
jgi:hypothetical protein